MKREIRLPRIGQDVFEAKVTKIYAERGKTLVREDDPYIEIATDKVDIELPMPYSGIVLEVAVKVGQMVEMNQVLMVVDTIEGEDEDLIGRRERSAHAQVGLRYLRSKDPAFICSRPDLGARTFEEFQPFVEKMVILAKEFSKLSLDALDKDIVESLAAVLYYVTSLVTELDGFDPIKLGYRQFEEYQRIRWFVSINQEEALRQFSRLLAVIGIKQDEDLSQLPLSFPSVQSVTPPEKDRAYVFISYSHHDKKFAIDFAGRLNLRKIKYFLDVKSIAFGQEIDEKVHSDLRRASHIIPLISSSSVQSQWVAYEIGYARGRGIAVVPYLIYPGEIRLPAFISRHRYLLPDQEEVFLHQLAGFPYKG